MGNVCCEITSFECSSFLLDGFNECSFTDYVADADGKKFVRTSALNQPLIFNPHSSAHKTFKQYLAATKGRKASNRSNASAVSADQTSSASGASVAAANSASSATDDMPIALYLQPQVSQQQEPT